METDFIAGKYVLMPEARTYALGVEGLRQASVERPFTFKENLQARVEAYESGDYRLFETWLNSCTGIVYKAGTTKFKIIPQCAELIGINKDFSQRFLPVEYNTIMGVELDSSKGKYKQLLTKAEVLEHPAWLASVEGDRTLLSAYTDIVFKAYASKHSSRDESMGFYVKKNTPADELRNVFVHDLGNGSFAVGDDNLVISGRFLRR